MIFQLLALLNFDSRQVPVEVATVTYTNPGARLERLLPELSRSCGLQLVADKRMADMVLTLRLSHVSIKDTLARVAEATRGVWIQHGNQWKLYENVDAVDRLQTASVERHREDIHEMLAELRQAGEPKETRKPEDEPPSPADVAIAKLCPFFMQVNLVGLPISQRLVFSTRPRALQRPLPNGSEGIFENMVVALKSKPQDAEGDEREISGEPFKTDIAVSRVTDLRSESFEFQVTVFDADGKVVVRDSCTGELPERGPKVAELRPRDEIAITDKGRELRLAPMMAKRLLLRNPAQITSELRQILVNPLERDPVEPIGSALVAYADLHDVQLAASLTDGMTSRSLYARPSFRFESDVKKFLEANGAPEKNRWIVLSRPIPLVDDLKNLAQQADRRLLQKAVTKIRDVRCPSLVLLVQAIRDGLPLVADLEQRVLFPNLLEVPDFGMASSLALLNSEEVNSLLAGNRIPLSLTTPAFQGNIASEIFDSWDPALLIDSPSFQSPDHDYRCEPTEVVNARIPPEAFLQIQIRDSVGLESSTGDPSDLLSRTLHCDLASLASKLAMGKTTAPAYRVGIEHRYVLRVYLVPHVCWAVNTQIYEIPADGPLLMPEKFPPEVKKKLDDLVASHGSRHQNNGVGGTPR